jgi:hypothetical protein
MNWNCQKKHICIEPVIIYGKFDIYARSRRCVCIKGLTGGTGFACVLTFSLFYSPFLYTNTNCYVFLIRHWIQKITSYRMKSSDPCKLHIRKRKRVPKWEKTPTFFCKSCSIFTVFILFSTSTLLICILNVSLHSETHQLSNDVLTFTKFALLQEKKRFKAKNPHLLLLQKRKFQLVHYSIWSSYLNCVIDNTTLCIFILSGVYLNDMVSKKRN